mgnify:CR=1 FL=1
MRQYITMVTTSCGNKAGEYGVFLVRDCHPSLSSTAANSGITTLSPLWLLICQICRVSDPQIITLIHLYNHWHEPIIPISSMHTIQNPWYRSSLFWMHQALGTVKEMQIAATRVQTRLHSKHFFYHSEEVKPPKSVLPHNPLIKFEYPHITDSQISNSTTPRLTLMS